MRRWILILISILLILVGVYGAVAPHLDSGVQGILISSSLAINAIYSLLVIYFSTMSHGFSTHVVSEDKPFYWYFLIVFFLNVIAAIVLMTFS